MIKKVSIQERSIKSYEIFRRELKDKIKDIFIFNNKDRSNIIDKLESEQIEYNKYLVEFVLSSVLKNFNPK